MVGELVRADERSTTTTLRITEANIFLDKGLFTEAGIIENIAQTAAVQAGYNKDETKPAQVGFIGSVNNLKIYRLPKLGEEIETTVEVVHVIFGATVISGKVLCKGETIAECEMKIFLKEQN
jgi:3-hydroxymyristoyl/3-hydroxydecanoyl-(acyl carrier protein) dehydratase